MKESMDGGEAILEAFRRLGVDYIISSPGSEWPPVWEALARQWANEADGPKYIDCWHETTAVGMAMGYTSVTGRLQAVLLHAAQGPLQGSNAIQSAYHGEIPMLICSGEAITFGESQEVDPGQQWYQQYLSVVGGPDRFVEPYVKWSSHVTSPFTLHETVVRAGELAQRVPKGPTFLDIPLEIMLDEWSPPRRMAPVAAAPKTQPETDAINKVAELLFQSRNPIILTETCGYNVEAFGYLVRLAELLSIPVVEARSSLCVNFPKDHPLHMGYDATPFLSDSDLFLVIENKSPWYPPNSGPAAGTVVVIGENPIKGRMPYQNLQAHVYLEGNVAATLRLLVEALESGGSINVGEVKDRRTRWEAEHNALYEGYRSAALATKDDKPIDPLWLCETLNEVIPENATYVGETTGHKTVTLRHLRWNRPQGYFHPPAGGLGVGLGTALGVKLAMPERPVVALIGDGAFL